MTVENYIFCLEQPMVCFLNMHFVKFLVSGVAMF